MALDGAQLYARLFVELCGRLDRLIDLQEKTNEHLLRLETASESRQLMADLRAEVEFEDDEQASIQLELAPLEENCSDEQAAPVRGLGALTRGLSAAAATPPPLQEVPSAS
jgi:hypothetical protein